MHLLYLIINYAQKKSQNILNNSIDYIELQQYYFHSTRLYL
jgi:hypothetical protein